MLPFLDQDHSSLRSRVRQWAEKNLISFGHGEQQIDEAAQRFVRQLGDEGFLACAVPEKFGGAREKVQARDLCVLREELARGSALADTMFAIQALGSYPITLFGSEEQKKLFLPILPRAQPSPRSLSPNLKPARTFPRCRPEPSVKEENIV